MTVQNSQLITNRPTKSTTTVLISEGARLQLNHSQITLIGDNLSSGITEDGGLLPSFATIQNSNVWVNIPTAGGSGYGISVDSGNEIIFEGGTIEVSAANGGLFSTGHPYH